MTADDGWNAQRWRIAIAAADTWRDPSTPKKPSKKTSDLKPLVELIRSDAPLPQSVREDLADLLTRHRLTLTSTGIPSYEASESQVNAQVLAEFAEEFKQQKNWPHGPITQTEMAEAVKVMQARAKAKGHPNVKFEGRKAATDLRRERLRAFADYYHLFEWKDGECDYRAFENAVSGKHGSIRRLKHRDPLAKRAS